MKLLTIGNPKTEKSVAFGYLTAVLHLAPSNLSGIANVCPRATAGCIASCLNTAGRGGIFRAGESSNAIQDCRIRRTEFLFRSPCEFLTTLAVEVSQHADRAKKLGLKPAVRLNGTSDLDWSQYWPDGFTFAGVVRDYASAGVSWYDYTKRTELFDVYARESFPIHLTFSRAETMANKRDARRMLEGGNNVAVVFDTRKGKALPATFEGRTVIDGDEHDLRFLDPSGVVVGLRAKGRARRDVSGFVVHTFPAYDCNTGRGIGRPYDAVRG